MRGRVPAVGVFVGDHRIDRGKNGFGSVDTAKNSRVFNFAPDRERRSLVTANALNSAADAEMALLVSGSSKAFCSSV